MPNQLRRSVSEILHVLSHTYVWLLIASSRACNDAVRAQTPQGRRWQIMDSGQLKEDGHGSHTKLFLCKHALLLLDLMEMDSEWRRCQYGKRLVCTRPPSRRRTGWKIYLTSSRNLMLMEDCEYACHPRLLLKSREIDLEW